MGLHQHEFSPDEVFNDPIGEDDYQRPVVVEMVLPWQGVDGALLVYRPRDYPAPNLPQLTTATLARLHWYPWRERAEGAA